MLSTNLLFYFFSGVLVFSAIMVIVASHSVFSLLFLVLSFLASAFLLLMLECEFLALIFIVVYVGAIAVLFLFALGFLAPILYQVSSSTENNTVFFSQSGYVNWYDLIDSTSDVEVYGQVLYSYFVLQFLVVGLILLVVLIGVVYLTNTYTSNKTVDQSTYKQLSVSSKFFY